jgi:hypothetical protein
MKPDRLTMSTVGCKVYKQKEIIDFSKVRLFLEYQ